jgi:hypothetical protein
LEDRSCHDAFPQRGVGCIDHSRCSKIRLCFSAARLGKNAPFV